jgi:lysozyme
MRSTGSNGITMNNVSTTLLAELKRQEGFSRTIYKCPAGFNTIGYGLNLDAGISEGLAEVILKYLINEVEQELIRKLDWFPNLTQARKEVLINMAFNLGIEGLLKFRHTLFLMENSRHEEAAVEMLNSKWASQVGGRARYLSEKYKRG